MAKVGETVTVRRISGKDEVRQHLAELGFVVDSKIGGNLIVQGKDSRIALDKTMLKRAGVSVAMGNACGELKALADVVCEDVSHDGVYLELHRMGLCG